RISAIISCLSAGGPYPELMDMQPSPSADTSRLLLPSFRFCMARLLHSHNEFTWYPVWRESQRTRRALRDPPAWRDASRSLFARLSSDLPIVRRPSERRPESFARP